jgi:hypothetical protein
MAKSKQQLVAEIDSLRYAVATLTKELSEARRIIHAQQDASGEFCKRTLLYLMTGREEALRLVRIKSIRERPASGPQACSPDCQERDSGRIGDKSWFPQSRRSR